MGSSPNDLILFALSSTLDIESLNIFFSYHVVGLVPSHSNKSLILMYMYTNFFAQFDVNLLCTLLWRNEYELQFHLHDDVENTCTKMWWVVGASVCPLVPIKSHQSCWNKSRFFIWGVLEKGPWLLTKFVKSFKTKTCSVEIPTIFHKKLFKALLCIYIIM
jgi:hypothetical protein